MFIIVFMFTTGFPRQHRRRRSCYEHPTNTNQRLMLSSLSFDVAVIPKFEGRLSGLFCCLATLMLPMYFWSLVGLSIDFKTSDVHRSISLLQQFECKCFLLFYHHVKPRRFNESYIKLYVHTKVIEIDVWRFIVVVVVVVVVVYVVVLIIVNGVAAVVLPFLCDTVLAN